MESALGADAKTEDAVTQDDQNGNQGQEDLSAMQDDDDDDIDFNLGNSNGYEAPSHQHQESHGTGIKEDG